MIRMLIDGRYESLGNKFGMLFEMPEVHQDIAIGCCISNVPKLHRNRCLIDELMSNLKLIDLCTGLILIGIVCVLRAVSSSSMINTSSRIRRCGLDTPKLD